MISGICDFVCAWVSVYMLSVISANDYELEIKWLRKRSIA